MFFLITLPKAIGKKFKPIAYIEKTDGRIGRKMQNRSYDWYVLSRHQLQLGIANMAPDRQQHCLDDRCGKTLPHSSNTTSIPAMLKQSALNMASASGTQRFQCAWKNNHSKAFWFRLGCG